jgi:hypothetical protein
MTSVPDPKDPNPYLHQPFSRSPPPTRSASATTTPSLIRAATHSFHTPYSTKTLSPNPVCIVKQSRLQAPAHPVDRRRRNPFQSLRKHNKPFIINTITAFSRHRITRPHDITTIRGESIVHLHHQRQNCAHAPPLHLKINPHKTPGSVRRLSPPRLHPSRPVPQNRQQPIPNQSFTPCPGSFHRSNIFTAAVAGTTDPAKRTHTPSNHLKEKFLSGRSLHDLAGPVHLCHNCRGPIERPRGSTPRGLKRRKKNVTAYLTLRMFNYATCAR